MESGGRREVRGVPHGKLDRYGEERESLYVYERIEQVSLALLWPVIKEVVLTWTLHRFITLVCIMGEENPTDIQTYIEHNVTVFQGGLNTVLDRLKVLCA